MTVWDRVDAWLFKPVDAFVLWAWNELGVKYQTIAGASLFAAFVANLLSMSDWGKHYGVTFWTWGPLLGFANTALIIGVQTMPAEARNVMNLRIRHSSFMRFLRAGWVAMIAINACTADPNWCIDALNLWAFTVLYALVPTRPRNKKRREVLFGKLAAARS